MRHSTFPVGRYCLALVVCAAPALGQSPGRVRGVAAPDQIALDERIEQLKQLASPQADDWQTEADADRASAVLKDLAHQLSAARGRPDPGVARFFTSDCRLSPLRPAEAPSLAIGGFELRRADCRDAPHLLPQEALRELLDPHDGAADLRFTAKLIGIEALGDGDFQTQVMVQSCSTGDRGRLQQNATWDVLWTPEQGGDRPLIRRLTSVAIDELRTNHLPFKDGTRSVIRDDAAWNPRLARGNDWWYGRTDALGGVNFISSEGLAVGDVNGDGLDDLYVCMRNGLPNMLFVQNPDGTVRETAYLAGVAWLDQCRGALLVDMDNDGDEDLVVAIDSTVGYCENDGNGVFTARYRFKMPKSSPGAFYSLAAADYDADGDLDIYACRYLQGEYGGVPPEPYFDANNGPSNHLLRNDGRKGLTDVTVETGLDVNNRRFSVVASWVDYDDDGDPDLYVANDFGKNNLYRNNGGTFVDVAATSSTEDQASGMGISWSDFDLDGDLDLLISNMFSSAGRRVTRQSRSMRGAPEPDRQSLQRLAVGNTLLINDGGRFRDDSDRAGIRMGRWAWGAMFADINNDGFDDMVVPNGFITNESKDDL